MSSVITVPKCVVCGCTDEHGCDEGCCWSLSDPPVCSSCIRPFLFAALWQAIGLFENDDPRAAAGVRQLRTFYRELAHDPAASIPSLKDVAAINRRAAKWKETHNVSG